MRKKIISLIVIVVTIPFFVSYFFDYSQVIEKENNKEIPNKESKKVKEPEIDAESGPLDGYDEGGFGGSRYYEIKEKKPNKSYEEILREDAERERKRALGIKENLEWLQEDIEIDYVNQEKKMIEPFNIIREEDVGWDIQTVNSVDFYNLEKINNYLPVQLKVEQIAKGMFQGKVKSTKISVPSGKEQIFSARDENRIKIEPYGDSVRIFMFLTIENSNSGILMLGGDNKEGYKGYVEGGGLGGRHIIKLDKNGKGYVYNIFN